LLAGFLAAVVLLDMRILACDLFPMMKRLAGISFIFHK